VLPRPTLIRLRQKSLVRAILLSLGAFAVSLRLAGFPYIDRLHGSYWQFAAMAVALWGMAETARCLNRKWNLYYAGILLLLYTNLMILTLMGFLVAYP
jgi:hypothetical protein